jgi:hypothetical protein
VRKLDRNTPAVDQAGRPTQALQIFVEEVSKLPTILGTGSPVGAVEARAGRTYIDTTDDTKVYFKMVDSVGGDKTLGWKYAALL